VWVVRLASKTDSDEAIRKILLDSKVRSGRRVRFLKTDGDGIFGRSRSFQELRERENFVHERPAPFDHNQNALIDRECRTLLEAASTALIKSGAPSTFWGEATDHFVFTKNNLPSHEVLKEGKKIFVSPNNYHSGADNKFNLSHLVAFGTQATCYIPRERREGKKTPGQDKTFDGVVVGYVSDMRAYRIWDIEKRKVREISYNFAVISEGYFPFRDRKTWPEVQEKIPVHFFPTFESFVDKNEWKLFGFSKEQEAEVIKKKLFVSSDSSSSVSPSLPPPPLTLPTPPTSGPVGPEKGFYSDMPALENFQGGGEKKIKRGEGGRGGASP